MKKATLVIAIIICSLPAVFAQTSKYTKTMQMYLEVKNALVTDNSKVAASAAKQLSESITRQDNAGAKVSKLAATIAGTNDISAQRKTFVQLSKLLVDNIGEYRGTDPVYIDYCPMKKAYWISEVKEIKNPYYGASMLTCGKITETK